MCEAARCDFNVFCGVVGLVYESTRGDVSVGIGVFFCFSFLPPNFGLTRSRMVLEVTLKLALQSALGHRVV